MPIGLDKYLLARVLLELKNHTTSIENISLIEKMTKLQKKISKTMIGSLKVMLSRFSDIKFCANM